jgi:hypothetical protein
MATSHSSPRPRQRKPRLDRLVSGGQTGVDRGALDAALAHGVPCGGWCPKGRRAEDGVIPPHYPLTECDSRAYKTRTKMNVRDSDATLILTDNRPPSGGTLATIRFAEALGKPHMVAPLDADPREIMRWLAEARCRILNVAGPRESRAPGIQTRARRFVAAILARRAKP